jgi:hypothetical protein
MLENEIRNAEADVQDATRALEEEAKPRGVVGEKIIAAAIVQAGAQIALALLRSAQALAQNMGDPRR